MVAGIDPLDDLEAEHVAAALAWMAGTTDLFRRQSRPVAPRQHLVSYLLLVDPADDSVLLCDHRKSGLWLPTGGHVEVDEDPVETVRRECIEELGVEAVFAPALGERPTFLTVTETVGGADLDVSLWFVLDGRSDQTLTPDPGEFHGVRWWRPAEIRATDPRLFDPHLTRMLDKLAATRV